MSKYHKQKQSSGEKKKKLRHQDRRFLQRESVQEVSQVASTFPLRPTENRAESFA